ncbi:MAG: hypothetical protein ACI3YK_00235, partial [Eubacteriales bacterium]
MRIKPIHSLICLMMAATLLLSSCGGGKETNTNTDTVTNEAQTGETTDTSDNETPTSATISITCGSRSASGEGSVELTTTRTSFKKGNKVVVTLPEGQHYVAFCLAKDVLAESILYVSGNTFEYTIPTLTYSYPSELSAPTITARIPDASELTASHNLALNPADLLDPDMVVTGYTFDAYWDGNVFPHATTSSICRFASSEESKYQFEARNAIDGFTQNNGHGNYPVQSWGPDSDFSTRTGYITIDFGHDVKVDTLNLYIRADFPHDTYFTSATIKFTDGSELDIDLTNSASVQSFDLGGRTTSSIKLTSLSMADPSGWAG